MALISAAASGILRSWGIIARTCSAGWLRIHSMPFFTARTNRRGTSPLCVSHRSRATMLVFENVSVPNTMRAPSGVRVSARNRMEAFRCFTIGIALPTSTAASTLPCSSAAIDVAAVPTGTTLTSSADKPCATSRAFRNWCVAEPGADTPTERRLRSRTSRMVCVIPGATASARIGRVYRFMKQRIAAPSLAA